MSIFSSPLNHNPQISPSLSAKKQRLLQIPSSDPNATAYVLFFFRRYRSSQFAHNRTRHMILVDATIAAETTIGFCSLDIVELCGHIDDDHPSEDDTLGCPVCATSVDKDMVHHITARHGNLYRILAKLKQLKGKSHSSISYLKNELQNERRKSLLSSQVVSLASNPLLSSFIYNLPMVSEPKKSAQHSCSTEPSLVEKSSDEINSERKIQPSSSSIRQGTCGE